MESFYLTLISNDSLNFFPDNVPNSFINRLDEPIHLSDSNYEMALCEMSYIAGFKNNEYNASFDCFDFLADYRAPQDNGNKEKEIQDNVNKEKEIQSKKKRKRNLSEVNEIVSKKKKFDLINPEPKKYGKLTTIHLRQLSISSPTELASILNEQVWLQVPRFKFIKKEIFSYDQVQKRIWLNFENDIDYITIKLHSNVLRLIGCMNYPKPSQAVILGRDKRAYGYLYEGKHRYFGPAYVNMVMKSTCKARDFFRYEPKINNVDAFLIYTNLIKPCQIGSGRANLLRFVDVPPKNEKSQRISINLGGNFFYKKIYLRDICDIQIKINDIRNNPVKFNSYVRIVVHIRPRK